MFLFTVQITDVYTALYALNRIADNCCWSVHSTVYTPVVVRCSLELSAVSNPVSVSFLRINLSAT